MQKPAPLKYRPPSLFFYRCLPLLKTSVLALNIRLARIPLKMCCCFCVGAQKRKAHAQEFKAPERQQQQNSDARKLLSESDVELYETLSTSEIPQVSRHRRIAYVANSKSFLSSHISLIVLCAPRTLCKSLDCVIEKEELLAFRFFYFDLASLKGCSLNASLMPPILRIMDPLTPIICISAHSWAI